MNAKMNIKKGKRKMNSCKNCGKEIPDDKWCCDEECVREYYGKKKVNK